MTVRELYNQVALLGFEDSLESNNAFYFAANRAIYQINLLRPHISEYTIFRFAQKNLLGNEFKSYTVENQLIFEADSARAYYFESAGKGTVYIEEYNDGEWNLLENISFTSNSFEAKRGFIKNGNNFTSKRVRLRFAAHSAGDFIYYVQNVALYRNVFGSGADDIPSFTQWTEYDMSKLCPNFMTFEAPPIKADDLKRLGAGYEVYGGKRLLLPHEAEGSFRVMYRRKPAEIDISVDPENDGTAIDLDDDLCQLLPLLVAAYIWVDDESGKAEYYMALYRERAQEIVYTKAATSAKITNESGW